MGNYHSEIISLIRKIAPKESNQWVGEKYLGTTHVYLGVGTLPKRKIAKEWSKSHPSLDYNDYINLLSDLYFGETYEEKTLASELLNLYPKHRNRIELQKIYDWLKELDGWAEIDILCQGSFPANEVLARWEEWKPFLSKLNKSRNIRHRRASLVLMCKSIRESDDSRLWDLAVRNIENTQLERDILVTKAVSWLLRSSIKHHRVEVEKYLSANEDKLPKIALRETRRKLTTGKK